MQGQFDIDRLRGRAPKTAPKAALSAAALAVRAGTWLLLRDMGFAAQAEIRLKTSRAAPARRADLMAVNRAGDIIIVEVKSGVADFRSDHKWPEYLGYCDRFYFAVDEHFPRHLLAQPAARPDVCGLIIADKFGGAIVRDAASLTLNAARRKKLMIELALAGGRTPPSL